MGIDWNTDLDEYIRQAEPEIAGRSAAWQTAIGLQAVDGLKPSAYLLDTARAHIEGKISLEAVSGRVISYYEQRSERESVERGTKEADIVSTRIAELLSVRTFHFSPAEFQNVHRYLFADVFAHAGKYRDYNITKKEWVLNGDTVTYAHCDSIGRTLEYDFGREKNFSYRGLSPVEFSRHMASFTSDIWQVHPFCEGNTRATAVFIVLYLRSLGFSVDNGIFARHSWYFRNALVRANFEDFQKDIHATPAYLEGFFENLLFKGQHALRNRYLHVDYVEDTGDKSAKSASPKCTLCTLEERAVLDALKKQPKLTQQQLSEMLGISLRTIKKITIDLQKAGLLERTGGRRNGIWIIPAGQGIGES